MLYLPGPVKTDNLGDPINIIMHTLKLHHTSYTQGRRNWGGRRGSRPRCPLPGGARGAKVPFQFKGLPWRNSELSEM
jgi:hypothetical protein